MPPPSQSQKPALAKGTLDAMHTRLDKLERERRDATEALEMRHRSLQASLEDLDARCKATHGKIKRRQEIFADQLGVAR